MLIRGPLGRFAISMMILAPIALGATGCAGGTEIRQVQAGGQRTFLSDATEQAQSTAHLEGTLEVGDGGCWLARLPDDTTEVLVIWPQRTSVSEGHPALQLDGDEYSQGSPIAFGGGYREIAEREPAAECGAKEAFIIN